MNLRDRARTLLQGLTSSPLPKVQPYSVVCPEGHRLRGQRTVGYQALRCPTCGEGVFVLPRSPLPEPAMPAAGARKRQPIAAAVPEHEADLAPVPLTDPVVVADGDDGVGEVDGEVVWLDEAAPPASYDPAEAGMAEIEQQAQRERRAATGRQGEGAATSAPETAGAGPRSARRGSRSTGARGRTGAVEAEADPATAVAVSPRESLRDWARRRRNPLLFLAVVLLIAATASFRLWRQHRQDLPRIAALGRVEGLTALDEGDFDKAYQLLAPARDAVAALGDAVEGAAQIRQGAAEADIFISLVPERLETILDAAARYDPKEWPRHFANLYGGRSIIIDAHVIAVPESTGSAPGRYELDYQILPDGEGKLFRAGRIDLTGFQLFESTRPRLGDHVTFGARLASFTFDDQTNEWTVAVDPKSGVFLTHPKALEALGWPDVGDLSAKEGVEP